MIKAADRIFRIGKEFLKDIGKWANRFQIFELGNSIVLYYLLIFYLLPVSVLLGFPLKYSLENYHINYLALGYLALGLLFFLLGYYHGYSGVLAKKVPNILKKEWDFSRALYAFWIFFTIGLAVKLILVWGGAYSFRGQTDFLIKSSVYSTIGFLQWAGYIALTIAFIAYFHFKRTGDRRYKMWRMFAWGAFAVEMAYALPSCVRMNVIVPILLYLLLRAFLVKLDYRLMVFWGVVLIVLIFPFGNACRMPQLLKYHGLSPEGGIQLEKAPYFVAETFMGRLGQSTVFAGILEHPQPLWYGKPLLNFFVSLGPPRFIWKSKPVITANGNEFGRRIGVLAPDNYRTFVGPTFVGDWYMNFGLPGIIAGMCFLGVVFRFIFDYLMRFTGTSLSGLLVYAIVWIQLMKGFEDSLAPVFAGLVKVSVLLFFISLFLQGDVIAMWRSARRRIKI